jgi:starch synthase
MGSEKLENKMEEASSNSAPTPVRKPSILMAAAECTPFAKTGGLADVVGTLARELKAQGFDIRLVLPYHRVIKDKYRESASHLVSFGVDLGWRSQYVGVELLDWDGIPIYFIDNEYYFGHAIYRGGSFEGEQYAYFSRAVLEALPLVGFEPDIIHVNDWHTAMIPMLLRTQYGGRPQEKAKTVLSIHSLGYQGRFDFGFVADLLGIDGKYYNSDYLEFHGGANFMKGGIVFADKIVTVSPTYAEEIRTPYYGEGLDGVLQTREKDLVGILNGIDTAAFNPADDPQVPHHFSGDNLDGKQRDKEALISELGLKISPGTPLVGMVSRLTRQKGLDLLLRVFDELMKEDVGLVLLGTGDMEYEDFFRSAAYRTDGRAKGLTMFDDALAHRIYAGSDLFLMPSRYEPCGLAQMISLRYGTLPIVRATGGLKDTVTPYNEFTGEGNGFSFVNYNAHDMLNTIRYALGVCRDANRLKSLRQRAMAQDMSFKKSADAYARLYTAISE